MSRSHLGAHGLFARQMRVGVTGSILLALLVAASTLAVSLALRTLALVDTAQLQHTVGALLPNQRDLVASGTFGTPYIQGRPPATAAEIFGAFSSAVDQVGTDAPPSIARVLGRPEWVVSTASHEADPVDARGRTTHPVLTLAITLDWASRVTIVEGTLPAAWRGQDSDNHDPASRPPIEIALPASAATLAGLKVGDVLNYDPAPLRIAALYKPKDSDDAFWSHEPGLKRGKAFDGPGGVAVYADAFADPGTAVGLRQTMASGTYTAWYPLVADELQFGDPQTFSAQARSLRATGAQLTPTEDASFSWGLPETVSSVSQRIALVTTLLALIATGPIGVMLAVLTLGVQSIIDRRRPSLSLVRARGGSLTQVRSIAAAEGALISLPAAILGYLAAGALLPGVPSPGGLALPALFAAVPPLLFAVFATRSSSVRRSDLSVRSSNGGRWVVEVAIIGLATLSPSLLFRRGLAQASLTVGVDPLLIATPLLLSLAVCILVLRLYPALMTAVHRVARSQRNVVGLVGTARATRAPALGFVAALALIVGISTAVFSVALGSTVTGALKADARSSVGADIRVESIRLDAATRDRIAALPGVASVVALQRVPSPVTANGVPPATVVVVVVKLDYLRRARPDLAIGSPRRGALPVYLSHDLARYLGTRSLTLNGHPATFAGELPSNLLPNVRGSWALIDVSNVSKVAAGFDADTLLVDFRPGAHSESTSVAIGRAAADHNQNGTDRVDVVSARQSLATASAEPVIAGLERALFLAAVASALLSMLAVVLASISSAGLRNRMIGILRILGTSPRQVTGLAAWELVPITLTAVIAGTLLGLGELGVVSAVVDLRQFLHGTIAPKAIVDPVALAAVVIVFVAVVAFAGLVTIEVGRRYSPTRSIKLGAE